MQINMCQKLRCWHAQSIEVDKGLDQTLYRGSYMSANLLLNLLNELGKRDQMRGLPRNKFNKFNNMRAGMLDSIYQMTLRLL